MELQLKDVTKKYGEKVALDFTESWAPTAQEKAP